MQSGRAVTVASDGRFTATLGAGTALALHVGARTCSGTPAGSAGASFAVNATTAVGQNIFVTGDRAELGNWNTGGA